jgi:hypothetical protein
MFCRDNPDDCVQYSIDRGSIWGRGHLAWMMNEINKLVWPAPDGIGSLDLDVLGQTIETATAAGILTAAPTMRRSTQPSAKREGLDATRPATAGKRLWWRSPPAASKRHGGIARQL